MNYELIEQVENAIFTKEAQTILQQESIICNGNVNTNKLNILSGIAVPTLIDAIKEAGIEQNKIYEHIRNLYQKDEQMQSTIS